MAKRFVLDARGAEIKAGQLVVWFATGSYVYPGVHKVEDVKTRVKLDNGSWVNSYNVIVVDSVPEIHKREEKEEVRYE